MTAILDFKMADQLAANEIIFDIRPKTITDMQVFPAGIPQGFLGGRPIQWWELEFQKNDGHIGFQNGRQVEMMADMLYFKMATKWTTNDNVFLQLHNNYNRYRGNSSGGTHVLLGELSNDGG